MTELVRRLRRRVGEVDPVAHAGRVVRAVGLAVESRGPRVAVGEECRLESAGGELLSLAEVVGFEGNTIYTMPVDPVRGLRRGDRVVATGSHPRVPVGDALLGRVLDADGRPIDGGPPPPVTERAVIHRDPIPALARPLIDEPLVTGVRAIDGLVTIGRGQRIGIFAGSGVGKSRLLGALARHARDDVIVIALVGERNREVREFVERELAGGGRDRSVTFVATSDESPLRRVRCALAATTVAEEFRAHGRNVTLLMDSVTRVAMALREIGLATGEPPSSKGYPPSVFAFLPRLLERAGRMSGGGSVTGIYTVFVEGDDLTDPVADASRAILDGHIVLSRELAERAHYPAIDVLASTSRVMLQVIDDRHRRAAERVRRLLAVHRENRDLVAIGAYKPGADPELDAAVSAHREIEAFLRQDLSEPSPWEETRQRLEAIAEPTP
ncbi:MAG: FliI/YscN family ATPase [Acidobacteria bacterium]|nr:MAG: FliI/YscN family ATPase [Acidobacteriota bacterium]